MSDQRLVLRGDLFGGVTAAIIALPLALAFGVAAVAPLGPESASLGALAGLLGAIFTGFLAALLGGTPVQITGPTGPMTVVVTSFIAASMVGRGPEHALMVMTLTGFAIALGGAFQIAIGVLGGGKLVKFIPYPVVAGFMNGIAIIIFLGQIKPFLGVTGSFSELTFGRAWPAILIGTATIAAILITKRVSKSVPASLVGLLVGIASYLAIAWLGFVPLKATANPLVVGPIPNPFASFANLQRAEPLFKLGTLASISVADAQRVVTTGLTLAILGSIDSLLTSVVADVITQSRHDSRKELVGQGVGNVVSGLLGGLAGAGATVRTLVNIHAGGKTRRSGMIHSGVILVVVVALGWPAGWIPLSALAGILFVTAYGIIDQYSLGLVRRRRVRSEFAIMIVVAAVTVAVDLMIAVAVGVATAALLFIVQQSRAGVMRGRLRGDEVFSRRRRKPEHLELLRERGAGTVVYQLSGALFFGTTDALLAEIETDGAKIERVILDFSRVREIDLSGVQLLLEIVDRLRGQGKKVALSGLSALEASWPHVHKTLVELGVLEKAGKDHVHLTLDRALEAFEDEILDEHHGPGSVELPLELPRFEAFSALPDEAVREISQQLIEQRDLAPGEVLFEEHTPAEHIAFVRSGRFSLVKKTARGESRLAVFGRGEMCGARVFFEHARWRSSLRAETPSSVYLLSRASLERLRVEHPDAHERLQRALLESTLTRMDAMESDVALLEES
jgi:SulP family sulfate permease